MSSQSLSLPERPKKKFTDTHLAPYGPKPQGKRAPLKKTFDLHSREGHAWRHEFRKHSIQLRLDRRKAEKEKKREELLYGKKPTLQERLDALPTPSYEPIRPKPVLIDFEKHSIEDLIRIIKPKFEATLKRLDVFETFDFSHEVAPDHIKDIKDLIDWLTRVNRSLKDFGPSSTKGEFQSWNYGLKEIGETSFKGLRRNQANIAKRLSQIWRSNYFVIA